MYKKKHLELPFDVSEIKSVEGYKVCMIPSSDIKIKLTDNESIEKIYSVINGQVLGNKRSYKEFGITCLPGYGFTFELNDSSTFIVRFSQYSEDAYTCDWGSDKNDTITNKQFSEIWDTLITCGDNSLA